MNNGTNGTVENTNLKEEVISLIEETTSNTSPIKVTTNDENLEKKTVLSITPELWVERTPPTHIKANLKDDKKENTDKKKDTQHLDDPKAYFDNTPSNILYNTKGQYTNLEELKKLIDENIPKNNNQTSKLMKFWGNLVSLGIALVPGLNIYGLNQRMKTVPQGKFQIVDKGGVYTTILQEGKHFLFNYFDQYGAMLDVDDEKNHTRSVGPNMKIVQVKPNHIGVVRLVNRLTYVNPETQKEEILGNAGDALLLLQGNYLFREDQFFDAKVYDLNDDRELVNGTENTDTNSYVDQIALMTVKKNSLGCAYNIEEGDFKLFESGKRRVFDKKEWRSFELKEITNNFKLGPWLFLTVEKGKHVCVHKKDGDYIVISEPGRYQFHKEEWAHETIEIKDKDTNVEFNKFWIFSAPHNHYAEVEDQFGNYHTLESGKKYYLEKEKFKKPIVRDRKDLANDLFIELGSKWIISPTQNVLIGAFNVQLNKFEVFENLETATELSKLIYPKIEKINKLSEKPQTFGPFKTINIAPGKKGILAEESGEIKIIEPGFHKFDGTATIREALPDRPIVMPIVLDNFLSQDLIDLQGSFDVQFQITDHKKLSNKLEVDQMDFSKFKNDLTSFVKGKLSQLLRNYTHLQLTFVKENTEETVNKSYRDVMEALSIVLQEHSKNSDFGISFGKAQLVSDIKINDSQVRNNYTVIEKSKLEIKAEQARVTEKEEKSKSNYEVDKNLIERQKDIDSKKVEATSSKAKLEERSKIEIEKISLEGAEEQKKISEQATIERDKLKKDAALDLKTKELNVEREALKYEEEQRLKKAEIAKKEKILDAETTSEQLKIEELTKAKIIEESAIHKSKAKEIEASAKMKEADAEAYHITKVSEAKAKGLELENEAKEKMPEKEVKIKLAEIEAEKLGNVFKGGIIYDQYAKFGLSFFETMLGKARIGGYGPELNGIMGDFKNIVEGHVVKKDTQKETKNETTESSIKLN